MQRYKPEQIVTVLRQIESASSFVRAFSVQQDSFTQTEYCRVGCDPVLEPLLVKSGVAFERYEFVLHVGQSSYNSASLNEAWDRSAMCFGRSTLATRPFCLILKEQP